MQSLILLDLEKLPQSLEEDYSRADVYNSLLAKSRQFDIQCF
jgi:hypothetical protein